MSRSPLVAFVRAATVALMATGALACAAAPGNRLASPPPAPACVSATTAPAAPVTWPVIDGDRRTVRVGLDVLGEASDAWRRLGSAKLDDALAAWNAAGLPIRLARETPTARADVQVVVMRRLPLDANDPDNAFRAGVTNLRHDARGAIASAQVMVAEETPRGARYSSVDQEATLLHELGHALGLAHLDDPRALMSPRSSAVRLTPADVAMARSGYGRASCVTTAMETASRPE